MVIVNGRMRLVNPYRGIIFCSNLEMPSGFLSIRTGGMVEPFQKWGFYRYFEGIEYYCGREFSRSEIGNWLGNQVLPTEDQPQEDWLGPIPANTPDPKDWKWIGFSVGEHRLPQQLKPTKADFQTLCGEALTLNSDTFYPLIDRFEIWVCDKVTKQPIALVSTGISLEDIDCQTFSPMVKFDWDLKDDHPGLRDLEDAINRAINTSESRSRFGCYTLLCEKKLDGQAIFYGRDNPQDPTSPLIPTEDKYILPDNWLAEEYWGTYQEFLAN